MMGLTALTQFLKTVVMVPQAASGLARQLEAVAPLITLATLPKAGRGLLADSDIPQGTTLFRERPLLATPPAESREECHQCLRPLASTAAATAAPQHPPPQFCSDGCSTAAVKEWMRVQQRAGLSALEATCAANGEKFPLLAARLACTLLQRSNRGGAEEQSLPHPANEDEDARCVPRGDPAEDLRHLCYANVPEPPPDWAGMHALLMRGLRPVGVPLDQLDLQWYCWVLSRLHLNVFRVDTVPALDLHADPGAMLRAAAASLAGGAGAHHRTGSAVYLLGSMFNHSCEPNVDVTFPRNDATVAFVAAADIPRGTELCISYIDVTMGRDARRQQLQFAYGFDCQCVRCREAV